MRFPSLCSLRGAGTITGRLACGGEHLLRGLKAASIEEICGSNSGETVSGSRLIRIKNGAEAPQLAAGAPIFVRHFYEPCVKNVMHDLDPLGTAKSRRFIVMGNPGSE